MKKYLLIVVAIVMAYLFTNVVKASPLLVAPLYLLLSMSLMAFLTQFMSLPGYILYCYAFFIAAAVVGLESLDNQVVIPPTATGGVQSVMYVLCLLTGGGIGHYLYARLAPRIHV